MKGSAGIDFGTICINAIYIFGEDVFEVKNKYERESQSGGAKLFMQILSGTSYPQDIEYERFSQYADIAYAGIDHNLQFAIKSRRDVTPDK